jgi:hypothetical protein
MNFIRPDVETQSMVAHNGGQHDRVGNQDTLLSQKEHFVEHKKGANEI